jgi:hypothetical protein
VLRRPQARSTLNIGSNNSLYPHSHFTEQLIDAFGHENTIQTTKPEEQCCAPPIQLQTTLTGDPQKQLAYSQSSRTGPMPNLQPYEQAAKEHTWQEQGLELGELLTALKGIS